MAWTIIIKKSLFILELINVIFGKNVLGSGRHAEFYFRLTQFLYSPKGAEYQKNFHFQDMLKCGNFSPHIELTQIEFTHRLFNGSTEHVPAMLKIKDIVNSYNFSSVAFPVGK